MKRVYRMIWIAVGCVLAAAPPPKPRLLIERLGAWTPPPAVGGFEYAEGRISVFFPDARFGVMNLMLGRAPHTNNVTAVLAQGYSLFAGCWSASGPLITVAARVAYLPALIKPTPGPLNLEYRIKAGTLFDGRSSINSNIERHGKYQPYETPVKSSMSLKLVSTVLN